MPTIDELKKVRLAKLEALKKLGIDPYPANVTRTQTISDAIALDGKPVAVVGRLTGLRGHGKIIFADLSDESGKIQLVLKTDAIEEKIFNLTEQLDMGDFLAVQGEVGKTQAGEVSIFVSNFQLIAKSLRPLPDKWSGFKDVEERYRQRYVDLLVNPEVRKVFITRSKVVQFLRKFLDAHGFLEVETPVLQPIYGGASAKPFKTHHNALDFDLFLRISDELYLKRLIVAGFEKVYDLSSCFRN